MITENNDVILDHSFKALKVDITDQILTITLNRPERLNTFDEGMKEDFRWIERRIEANGDIRVIIVNAEGTCLGLNRIFPPRGFGSNTVGSMIFLIDWNASKFL